VRLLLKDFQTDAVEQLVRHLRRGAVEAADGDLQAISLSSPTGSGKTVMLTAAIERLLAGDGDAPPLPDATFLWITDQPELNVQTRRKMLAMSSVLGPSELLVLDQSFDAEELPPNRVYFLNTQKLARNAALVTRGDGRTFTIWETVTNTALTRPGAFFLLIDEAHRGMTESSRTREEATTIIQKFIKGSSGELPPIPLVAGISATLERFQRLIEGTSRTARPVDIDPALVRDSGLLKEVITLYFPTDRDPSDITMLRAAAQAWRDMDQRWRTYCTAEDIPVVQPILVVQVEDGSGKQLSRTNLSEAIEAINNEVGPLPDVAFAHAFQEGTGLEIGGRTLRYVAPADVDADPDIRVVFFKTSLHTGWDCPRAEAMMSFRRALDATSIAQLVGRMVRTPLARSVESDESLNTVPLYLPHYDEEGLRRVVDQLTAPDPDALGPVKVERGTDRVVLSRAENSGRLFEALERIPSYVIPRMTKTSEVRRLMKFARLLANDRIDEDAPDTATTLLIGVLGTQHTRLSRTKQFRDIVVEKGTVELRSIGWHVGGEVEAGGGLRLAISSENIDDLFDAAGRRLGEGIHKTWWKRRVETDGVPKEQAKLEILALCLEDEVMDGLEATAQQRTQEWLVTHRHAIEALSEESRQEYGEIRRLASEPEESDLVYPHAIEISKGSKKWAQHLYVDADGQVPLSLNRWEDRVITDELARDDVKGWLRNVDRKPWALCVPYELGGMTKPLYPDFLILREEAGGHLAVDILDPHTITLDDAPAKAAGLARFADHHFHEFGRIELIIIDEGRTRRLDLTDESTRARVRGVRDHTHLRQLFEDA
jgi:type III restriction enzyme